MIKLIKDGLYNFYKLTEKDRSNNFYRNFDYSYSGEGWPTRIWLSNNGIFDSNETDKIFNDSFFKKKRVKWFIENSEEGKKLRNYLIKKGINYHYESPGMFTENKNFISENFKVIPEKIVEEKELIKFKTLVCSELFEIPEEYISSEIFREYLANPDIELYSLKDGEKTIATGSIYIQDNKGTILFISCDRNYRNMGFGSAITSYCVQKIKERGMDFSVLNATIQGEKVYSKIGFSSPVGFFILG